MYKKTKKELINFEKKICDIYESGYLPFTLHMCGGNEDQLIKIFKEINEHDYVFSTHRSHYHYLLKGGNDLEKKIRNGDSMFVFNKRLNFLTSSLLAGVCAIAAGVALSFYLKKIPNKVWCFIGDGAEDEGHFYEAAKFVESLNLPCTFIIEDNDRSVDANKEQRNSTAILTCFKCVKRYTYIPVYPHGQTGTKTRITWNEEIINNYRNKHD